MATTIRQPRRAGLTDRVRWSMIILGATTIALGAWSFFNPASFYHDFPIPGSGWVSTLGPLNEHLLEDFGSAEIGLGVAAIGVGWMRSVEGSLAVIVGLLAFGVLHLSYHIDTFPEFSVASAVAQATALILFIAIPAALLIGIRHQTRKETP